MKNPKKPKTSAPARSQVALLGGSYSLVISVVVLALLIVANIFVSALPTNLTKYDISSTKLYSITSNTKVVVNALEQDVTIYWIVQAGEEDDVIENLLGKYESLSDHISVVKRNPDVYPTFAEQYTKVTLPANAHNKKLTGSSWNLPALLEVTTRFELVNEGFADPCLTTWPRHLMSKIPA